MRWGEAGWAGDGGGRRRKSCKNTPHATPNLPPKKRRVALMQHYSIQQIQLSQATTSGHFSWTWTCLETLGSRKSKLDFSHFPSVTTLSNIIHHFYSKQVKPFTVIGRYWLTHVLYTCKTLTWVDKANSTMLFISPVYYERGQHI